MGGVEIKLSWTVLPKCIELAHLHQLLLKVVGVTSRKTT